MQLEKTSNDVINSDISTAKIFKINECETCVLIKSHVKISRNFDNSDSLNKPFH